MDRIEEGDDREDVEAYLKFLEDSVSDNVIPLSFTDENDVEQTLDMLDEGYVANIRNRDYAMTVKILGKSRGYRMDLSWDGDREVWVAERKES